MRRLLKITAVVLVLVLLVAGVWVYTLMRSGLAKLDGEVTLPGLTARVTIERDDHGVPRILADAAPDAFPPMVG